MGRCGQISMYMVTLFGSRTTCHTMHTLLSRCKVFVLRQPRIRAMEIPDDRPLLPEFTFVEQLTSSRSPQCAETGDERIRSPQVV
ncbi:hypothetical protein BD311DRAFT_755987 [Dichomitus squalens]|uniref:Uncharacterized protein n=1 Tax=Dichomitus squalens TaxID=114155 RepID=A0A4Q9MRG0_9APHY|nr:hypothetical protein BD311DRAFT_755987 [Dichomitus squalens]